MLWAFSGADSGNPAGGVIIDGAGNLFGAGNQGGRYGYGSVFELTPPAKGKNAWGKSIIWNFGAAGDGQNPASGLTLGSDGTIYGTTSAGGTGFGTVFALTPPAGGNGAWTEQLIATFDGGTIGAEPRAALTLNAQGVLFSTAYSGGANGNGSIYSLTPPTGGQGAWTGTLLYSFAAGDLDNSAAEVALGADGDLFGTTILGGHRGASVFQLAPPAHGGTVWTYRTIRDLPPPAELMDAGVTLTASGGLVGAGGGLGNGEVYRLTAPAPSRKAWVYEALARFNGHDGKGPFATPTSGADGTIYGTTEAGGPGGSGVVWQLTGVDAPSLHLK